MSSNEVVRRKNEAPVKEEFIDKKSVAKIASEAVFGDIDNNDDKKDLEPPKKKSRVTRKPGQNKGSAVKRYSESLRLCHKTSLDENCENELCKFSHDLQEYLRVKEKDLGNKCVNFEKFGKCRHGYACRFANSHIDLNGKLIINEESTIPNNNINVELVSEIKLLEKNIIEEKNVTTAQLHKTLRNRTYKFPKSEEYLREIQLEISQRLEVEKANRLAKQNAQDACIIESSDNDKGEPKLEILEENNERDDKLKEEREEAPIIIENKIEKQNNDDGDNVEAFIDMPDVPLRQCEKKKFSFKDKLYLAPLTTVGNLPFRRICKEFGADITCGEMAMATNILQGQQSEWALMKRHVSEDIFGVQICGNKVEYLVKCAEVLSNEIEVDFVDLNLGCPIDVVFNKGGGSALLRHDGRLGKMLRGMNRIIDVPITVKLRTGISDKCYVAHKLIPKFENWGVSLATVSNGDILGYEDYYQHIEKNNIDGVMIARGALIKPWIFDEIKSKKHYDISSKERFEILKKFCDYGMEHWGADTIVGIQIYVYMFLYNYMSVLYIPVGLLEVLPQRINERPPLFHGRDELETLLASPNSNDWVKISEMLLGPTPDNFTFVPKHKANSYEG
ncbi:17918_t:CDS:10 [Entrophospora sp. SA101]|nr:17918_t:CDS:10 [Entrophospora sp. SA101]